MNVQARAKVVNGNFRVTLLTNAKGFRVLRICVRYLHIINCELYTYFFSPKLQWTTLKNNTLQSNFRKKLKKNY